MSCAISRKYLIRGSQSESLGHECCEILHSPGFETFVRVVKPKWTERNPRPQTPEGVLAGHGEPIPRPEIPHSPALRSLNRIGGLQPCGNLFYSKQVPSSYAKHSFHLRHHALSLAIKLIVRTACAALSASPPAHVCDGALTQMFTHLQSASVNV